MGYFRLCGLVLMMGMVIFTIHTVQSNAVDEASYLSSTNTKKSSMPQYELVADAYNHFFVRIKAGRTRRTSPPPPPVANPAVRVQVPPSSPTLPSSQPPLPLAKL
uniref:Transmembrane protein n=1 Tax=Nelumbo nucifera TaxID=4432 RepID=A0A822XI25_NELNU|nr:TPA_asm: hypothetical protein HUJ06_021340 [Nelumbo nucifera]